MAEQPKACPAFRTTIGGQALIEGIMMLGPDKKGIVVRKPDGELEIKEEPRKLIKDKYPILGWPLIRGVVNFGSSMINGVKALMWSAEFYPEDELPHVKYKFYKGSSKARGSGIGLAVCDEIITRHNGTLDIGNAEGGGCIVTIRLPIDITAGNGT